MFRTAYRIDLNAERLVLVRHATAVLESIYVADVERFLQFLDGLAQ
jgi:hypothetical protein